MECMILKISLQISPIIDMINKMKFLNNYKKQIYWATFFLMLIALIFVQYFGLIKYQYLVPPGHDGMMHWHMIQPYYDGTKTFWQAINAGDYPPLYHWLITQISQVTNLSIIDTIKWTSPAILVFSSLTIFIFTYKIFGKYPALLAFFIYSFLNKLSIQQLNDGGYPNLIAAQIFIPLLFLILICLPIVKKFWQKFCLGIITIFVLFLIYSVHHLSTLYTIGLLFIYIIPFLYILKKFSHLKQKQFWLSIVLVFIFAIIFSYVYFKTNIFASSDSLLSQYFTRSADFPYFKIIPNTDKEALIGLKQYPFELGFIATIFGFIGLFYNWKQKKNYSNQYLFFAGLSVVTIWTSMLLIGSRMTFLSNPDRLLRDLIYPLSIVASIAIFGIYQKIHRQKLTVIIFIFALAVLAYPSLKRRVINALQYEPMVRYTQADQELVDYLNSQPSGKILIQGYDFYFDAFLNEDWDIDYLWLPQTYQPPEIHPLNPENPEDLAILQNYDYIYIVDYQKGWVPSEVETRFVDFYLFSEKIKLINSAKSLTNEIYLLKIIKD